MLRYSLIIPVYNEGFHLEENLKKLTLIKNIEIIVVDGGSTDGSIKISNRFNVKTVQSPAGRGIQLNTGVEVANGEILCFLHADTFLPENAFGLLNEYFENPNNKICRFKLGFDIDHWLLNIYKSFSKFDTIFTRFGDSFIAARKDFYEQIGGFPNWKIFEDVEFFCKTAKLEKIKILNAEVTSSARTFTKYGLVKQQIFSGIYLFKYFLGFRKFINNLEYYSRDEVNKKTSIIVFIKYPTEGKVKTRLAKTIGNTTAAQLYKNIAENIVHSVKQIKSSYNYIFYSDKSEKQEIKKWLGWNLFYCCQDGIDLGERMQNAFRKVFGHGAKKVIIVGTDIPDLSNDIINSAIDELNQNDIVIGPSYDGGFYLLGMKKYIPEVFENIKYSTDSVFDETVNKIKKMDLSYQTMETLQDIDTENDLNKWVENTSNITLKKKIEETLKQTKELDTMRREAM